MQPYIRKLFILDVSSNLAYAEQILRPRHGHECIRGRRPRQALLTCRENLNFLASSTYPERDKYNQCSCSCAYRHCTPITKVGK